MHYRKNGTDEEVDAMFFDMEDKGDEIAAWCGGTLHQDDAGMYVSVPVGDKTVRAGRNQLVVKDGDGQFSVVGMDDFNQNYSFMPRHRTAR